VRAEVAVVGAGIIGCSVARCLARQGVRVMVLDRDEPGRNASWAAAGMLAPQAEADQADPFLRLLLASRGLFPGLAADLREETGIDVGYRDDGTLLVALTEDEEDHLRGRFRWQSEAGLEVELLSTGEALRLEPILSPRIRCALRFPGDHQVENRQLRRALALSARAAGADFRIGAAIRRMVPGTANLALELEDGERFEVERVIVAAGAWSGQLRGLPRRLPVEPVHGQLVSLEMASPPMRHVVVGGSGYLVPKVDGRLIAGTTMERAGFRTAVTAAGQHGVMGAALGMAPTLANWPVTSHWAGLRPGTPDTLPILGVEPLHPGVVYATGHYRNGILLAPITGELIRDVVLGRTPHVDLTPFRPERFHDPLPETASPSG